MTVLVENEAQFQQAVINLARICRWRVAHFRPARTEKGWRTPVEADGAGFPDLVLVRGVELVFAELKSDKGKVSDKQRIWQDALQPVGDAISDVLLAAYGAGVCDGLREPDGPMPSLIAVVWRPKDWPVIEAMLK